MPNEFEFPRRTFLKLMIVAGGVVGCRGAITPSPAPLGTPAGTLPPTVGVETRFTLEDEAVSYAPNPAGCERTTIQGTVRDSAGAGVSGASIRVWDADPAAASLIQTDAQGMYSLDVANDLSSAEYHLQIVDESGGVLLSDVIVAAAIPDCNLNLLTVNFVASR